MNAIATASSFFAERGPYGVDFSHSSDPAPAPHRSTSGTAASLIAELSAASSEVARGRILRALDAVTGSRSETDALLSGRPSNRQADAPGQSVPAAKAPGPKYTNATLYGPAGPRASDVRQDALGDCYFVATLAAVAQERPQAIRDAIGYNAKTGNFTVRLHDASGKPVHVRVTQADIAYNIKRQGGSTMDNTGKTGPAWPAVMETAFAKLRDSNHANGLKQGFDVIGGGGYPADAMRMITGNSGTEAKFDQGLFETRGSALDRLGSSVQTALKADKPVTAWSVEESDSRSWIDRLKGDAIPQDGLVDNHVYSVRSIRKDAAGDWQVSLRNPWATNLLVGEGRDTASAIITVPLSTLVATGGLQSFRVGK